MTDYAAPGEGGAPSGPDDPLNAPGLLQQFGNGLLQQFTTPGAAMQPNPYVAGSEEATWYDQNRQDTMNQWAPGMALNMLGAGTSFAKPGTLGTAGGLMRVYHGSPNEFSAFDPQHFGKTTDAGHMGQGAYFSTDPKVAAGSPNQYAVDVSMSNPLRVELPDFRTDKRFVVREALGLPKTATAAEVTEAARAAGHDGVVLDYSPTGYNHKEVALFDPKNADIVSRNGQSVDAVARDMYGVQQAGGKLLPDDPELRSTYGVQAYHGSPHDFDRFDMSKIGTGEGAQAYGHGLYFTEKEAVAKSYRDQLAPAPGLTAAEDLADQYLSMTPNRKEAKSQLWDAIKDLPAGHVLQKDYQAALDLLHSDWKPPPSPGKIYQVGIKANPEHFLDWEGKLGDQPQPVKDYFAKQLDQFGPNSSMEAQMKIAGSRHPGGMQGVTKDLAARGVPGIKYLDQGSRAAGEGSRNYVVFNHDLVDILRKYGMAGVPAAGAAGAAADDLAAQFGVGQQ